MRSQEENQALDEAYNRQSLPRNHYACFAEGWDAGAAYARHQPGVHCTTCGEDTNESDRAKLCSNGFHARGGLGSMFDGVRRSAKK